MRGYIHSIESFGTLDGPGIRFVVFFAGCPMRCLYCHNPDTWKLSGETMESGDVLEKMRRNLPFYKSGGITATGGEPLMQLRFLTELFKGAHDEGINTCLDTSGILFTRSPEYDELIKYTDLVMLDIKHLDESEHIRLTGHSNRPVLEFADYLSEKGVPIRIRHVVVPGITYNAEHLERLGEYAKSLPTLENVELLPYHTMGKAKYEKLGIPYPLGDTPPLSQEEETEARRILDGALGRKSI